MTKAQERILAIDHGDRYVGLAMSDAMGWGALPLPYVINKGHLSVCKSLESVFPERMEDLKTIIIGCPLTAGGKETLQSRKIRSFFRFCVDYFSSQLVLLYDEYLTSQLAMGRLTEQGMKMKKSKKKVHSYAAMILLESYLKSDR